MRKIDYSELQNRNDVLYANNEQRPYTGIAMDYDNNVQIQVLNGKPHGEAMDIYDKGNTQITEACRNLKFVRRKSKFAVLGGLIVLCISGFIYDFIKETIIDDKLNGEIVSYYKNGQIYEKSNYLNGKLHGEVIEYYENGQVRCKDHYTNGELHGESTTYFENGQIESKSSYINGVLQK